MAKAIGDVIPATVIEDPVKAARFLLDRVDPDDVILVTGSLYLLGEVRPFLGEIAARKAQGSDSRL
jgi:folylpolyglutamate synthase/dihydropteroate synthase